VASPAPARDGGCGLCRGERDTLAVIFFRHQGRDRPSRLIGLADRGRVSTSMPGWVDYWPAFGAAGKEETAPSPCAWIIPPAFRRCGQPCRRAVGLDFEGMAARGRGAETPFLRARHGRKLPRAKPLAGQWAR